MAGSKGTQPPVTPQPSCPSAICIFLLFAFQRIFHLIDNTCFPNVYFPWPKLGRNILRAGYILFYNFMVGVSCAQKCDHYVSYWAFGNPTEKEKQFVFLSEYLNVREIMFLKLPPEKRFPWQLLRGAIRCPCSLVSEWQLQTRSRLE